MALAVAQNPNTQQETLMQLAGDRVYKIQLAVTKNPETSAGILAVLAEHEDKAIQAAVAEHGNITEALMHQLFPHHQSILKNRENLPSSILERFFNQRATNKPVWKDYDLRYLLLSQINTPTWILAEFANVDLEALRAEKLEQEMRPPRSTSGISEKWVQDNIRFLVDIAKHPQASVDILEKLVLYPNYDILFAVTKSSLISAELKMQLLEALVGTTNEEILIQLASDVDTPVSILQKIAEGEEYQNKFKVKLRRILTRKPKEDNRESPADLYMDEIHTVITKNQVSVDVEQWSTIIESCQWMTLLENYTYFDKLGERFHRDKEFSDFVVQQWSELLPTLTEQDLQKIISNVLGMSDMLSEVVKNCRRVSVALIGNPNTPTVLHEELLLRLTKPIDRFGSYSGDSDMRIALAYNSNIPKAQRIEYFQKLLSSGGYEERIARNPNTPQEIIAQIMTTKGVGRQAVSRNPNAPRDALAELAGDDSSTTRGWVAENPSTPVHILVQLARQYTSGKKNNGIPSVRETAIKNPNFPPLERYRLLIAMEDEQEIATTHELMARRSDSLYALAQVVEKGDQKAKLTAARSKKTPIKVLEQLARDEDEIIRSVVIENSNLPISSLLQLTQDTSLNVRTSLARSRNNKKVPVEVLERLANDKSERVRALVASNPDTPVELLRKLVNDSHREVWNALTRNKNTPIDILEFLGVEKGVVDIYNANTPGKALEKAVELTLKMDFRERDKILNDLLRGVQGSQMPANVLAKLANYSVSWVRSSVAAHPNTPISALESLVNDDYGPVLWAIARRADTPPHFLEKMLRGKDINSQDCQQICLAICHRHDIPHLLEKLMDSKLQEVHRGIAAQYNLPQAIVERLLITSDEYVLTTLVRNQSLSIEVLAKLASNPNPNVASAIANNSKMTQELWEKLAQHTEVRIRQSIAAALNTPVNILEILATDSDKDVRTKVATNNNVTGSILQLLAQDEDPSVRTVVANNRNTSAEILEQLASDKKVEVRRAVAQHPNTPLSIRESLSNLMLQSTRTQQISPSLGGLSRLYNPRTDDLPTILTEYAQSENTFVRLVTLMHPLAPENILKRAAQSVSWLERYGVAENPATSTEIKQQLTLDSNRIVRAVAMRNL
jgi:Leucine rich repeat variant